MRNVKHTTTEPDEAYVADLMRHVETYRRLAWCIVPVRPDEKKPAGKWKKYIDNPPTDDEIQAWFGQGEFGPAVVLGASRGLSCRDFDLPDGYDRWKAGHPDLAAILPTAKTRRGHPVYLRCPEAKHKGLGTAGEFRCGRHIVVLPPTRFGVHGKLQGRYAWIRPPTPQNVRAFTLDELGASGLTGQTSRAASETAIPLSGPLMSRFVPLMSPKRPAGDSARLGWGDLSAKDRAAVNRAIRQTLPVVVGQRHNFIFTLARKLKAIPALADRAGEELCVFLREWHRLALPFIHTKDYDTTRIAFLDAWTRIRIPVRETFMDDVLKQSAARPFHGYEDPKLNQLAALCRELGAISTDGEFILAARLAGELLGRTRMWAHRRLWLLQHDGLIVRTRQGTARGRRASRYRWVGPAAAEEGAS